MVLMIFENTKIFQIANPVRITFPLNEDGIERAQRLVRTLNGRVNVYRSIYNFWERPSYDKAFIDKIFFDFDKDGNGTELKDTRKLHSYLIDNQITHAIYFSGRGFHLFVKTKSLASWEIQNPVMAIKNAWNRISQEAKVNPDPATKDILRIARLPNSLNMKSGLFCIPLSYNDIESLEREEIEKLAERQRFKNYHTKEKEVLDLTEFDCNSDVFQPREICRNKDLDEKRLQERLPECAKACLEAEYAGFEGRFITILALKELNYSVGNTKKILEKYLSNNFKKGRDESEYDHCINENQVEYLYQRDFFWPSCEKIRADGLCCENCDGPTIYLE
jgi:hypothetical protein